MNFIPSEIIIKKKLGFPNSREELQFLISGFVDGTIPDYQMSAWAMAVYFNGMDIKETAELTQIMKDSGAVFDFSQWDVTVVDKHSTGGVGDKCTLIIAPIVAAAGVPVASIAGRGLGHTGGTIDKLESIPGFKAFIEKKEFSKNIKDIGFSIMGQTDDICPADKKLYALRDVTGTVDSQPLICASIMSKKLAEGIKGLVLDVKYGTGAFMKSPETALELAKKLKMIGENNGVKVHALISNMEQPLGRFIGNSLEVKESLDILQNRSFVEKDFDFYQDTRELSLLIAGHMICLGGKADSPDEGYKTAQQLLNSGQAYAKFLDFCNAQGKAKINKLPESRSIVPVTSPAGGYVESFNTENIGLAGVLLGAGRTKSSDKIDYSCGIEVHKKVGHSVSAGEPLFSIHVNNKSKIEEVKNKLAASIKISDNPVVPPKLVHSVLI